MKFTFQQVDERQENGPFKQKLTYMAGKDCPKQFRILPAFGEYMPDGRPEPMGYVPFEDDHGTNTPWVLGYREWSNIGHGPWGRNGTRRSFLRFDDLFEDYAFDAVTRVVNVARSDDNWRYLFEREEPNSARSDSVLRWYPDREILCNVVIYLPSGEQKTVIGSFSQALTRQLCGGTTRNGDADEGIINRPSNLPAEMLEADPYRRYWLGDITNPNMGVVLEIYKDESTVPARYKIRPAKDAATGGMKQIGFTQQQMADRVDLSRPSNILTPPEPQEEVDRMATCLNRWAPNGMHEYELLRVAYPEFNVPNPPPRGTVNGFTPPEAAREAQPQQAPQGQFQQPAYPPVAPVQQPQFQQPAYRPPQPPPQPQYTQQQPPAYTQAQFQQPAFRGPTPPNYAQQPQEPPATRPAFVPAAPADDGQPEPPADPALSPATPGIPGAPVPKFDPNAFMAKLKG